mmetsp:Transcript_24114/g.57155  ORF Transcript_24114/g.57155 Transcript_24114/m.57155 type:complete len:319 (-) Transcript_24114:1382-2338(-)
MEDLVVLVVQREAQYVHSRGDVRLGLDRGTQSSLSVRARQPDDRLETSRRDGQCPVVLPPPHLGVPPGDGLPGLLGQRRPDPGLGVVEVLPQELVLQHVVRVRIVIVLVRVCRLVVPGRGPDGNARLVLVLVVRGFLVILAVGRLLPPRRGALVPVASDDVRGDPPVALGVDLVEHDEEQVETTKKRVGQADVVLDPLPPVVLAVDGVRRRQDGAPRIEAGVHPGLGDGHCLLLHGLVDGHAVRLAHLVELVDADEAPVGEDHGPRLEAPLARLRVGRDGGREADAGRPLSGGGHGEGGDAHGAPEQLALGRRRVAHH